MNVLILDSESSGLPDWTAPSDAPQQPHMLQIAALRISLGSIAFPQRAETPFNAWIKPEGWAVDEREVGDDGKPTAFSINRISNAFLHEHGRPLAEVMDQFDAEFMAGAEEIYAYGAGFDRRILRIAALRRWGRDGHPRKGAAPPAWYCVLQTLTPLVALPPTDKMMNAGFKKFKPPTLAEAHTWAFGEGFDKAHDAAADLAATVRLFDHLRGKAVQFHRLRDRD